MELGMKISKCLANIDCRCPLYKIAQSLSTTNVMAYQNDFSHIDPFKMFQIYYDALILKMTQFLFLKCMKIRYLKQKLRISCSNNPEIINNFVERNSLILPIETF